MELDKRIAEQMKRIEALQKEIIEHEPSAEDVSRPEGLKRRRAATVRETIASLEARKKEAVARFDVAIAALGLNSPHWSGRPNLATYCTAVAASRRGVASGRVTMSPKVPVQGTAATMTDEPCRNHIAVFGDRRGRKLRGSLRFPYRLVTVLFADLKGSMEFLADRDPEESRTLLNAVVERTKRPGVPLPTPSPGWAWRNSATGVTWIEPMQRGVSCFMAIYLQPSRSLTLSRVRPARSSGKESRA